MLKTNDSKNKPTLNVYMFSELILIVRVHELQTPSLHIPNYPLTGAGINDNIFKGTACNKMREIDPSHVKRPVLPEMI